MTDQIVGEAAELKKEPPTFLKLYVLVSFLVLAVNLTLSLIDLDATLQVLRSSVLDALVGTGIEFGAHKIKSIFLSVTAVITLSQLGILYGLYAGAKIIRIMHLSFSFIVLPATLIGLLSFATYDMGEQVKAIISLILTVSGIVILFQKDVKEYFVTDNIKVSIENESIESQ